MGDCYTGTPSKLGFGLMRLPRDEKGNIDVEETSRMVDAFLAAGLTYFDTAYVYVRRRTRKKPKNRSR